jgi:hypothetical protein
MKTYAVTEMKELFRAWEWARNEVHAGKCIRLTIETEHEPITQVKRVLLWRALDLLSSSDVLESDSHLTSRQWYQIAAQGALGFDEVEIDREIYRIAREPKRLTRDDFNRICEQVLMLCAMYDIDLSSIENEASILDGPPS